jgi:hypothetical protein
MKLVFSFSFVLSVIIFFSIDPNTSLVAHSSYELNYREVSAPEDYNNNNKSITKRILVVDDNPDITFPFKQAFEANLAGGKTFHVDTSFRE